MKKGETNQQLLTKVGNEIRKRRKELGYTVIDLSNKVNYSKTHISKVENGLRVPSIEFLYRVCDVLNLPSEKIIVPLYSRKDVWNDLKENLPPFKSKKQEESMTNLFFELSNLDLLESESDMLVDIAKSIVKNRIKHK